MPATLTRLQITTRARRKADAVNDAHIEEDMLNDECNDLISVICKEVFAVDPDRYTTTVSASLTGVEEYTLPAGFMSIRRLDWVQGTTHQMIEPAPLLELDMSGENNNGRPCYRLIGGGQTGSTERLHIRPDPATGTYTLWYVATAPSLTSDGATFDCRFDEHRFVIAGLAAFIAERQQVDPSPFRAEQAFALEHVRTMARKRDSGRARQITDVRSQRFDWRYRYPRP